jgi:RNA polymerase sigma-70 factor (ECF subfamily)
MKIVTDSDMVKRLKQGDKKIIDHIYRQYHKRIFAFAYSLIKAEEDALDIVHEVFIKLWDHKEKLDENTKIESLIFTITRNTVLSIFRKRKSEKKYIKKFHKSAESEDVGAENQAEYNLLKEKVEAFVERMPSKRRQVFLLSRDRGLSNREIASQLNISEKTVEDHISKSLAFLKKHLQQYGILGTLFWYLFIG